MSHFKKKHNTCQQSLQEWKKIKKNEIKKQLQDNVIKSVRNVFKLEKENEVIKDRIIRDNSNLFDEEEENYYKPVRVGNFWSNNYIEYETNSNRNKIVAFKEYLNELIPRLSWNISCYLSICESL